MPLSDDRRREIVIELVSRPGHEKVRALVYALLVDGLGASSTEVHFERRVPEVHGRIDALLGRTVFEFKSNLNYETADAEEGLTRYLTDRQAETGSRFVGIATDGASFVPYELRSGRLRRLPGYQPAREDPSGLLVWLSAAVVVSSDLPPTPEIVTKELGRGSLAWILAREDLAALWAGIRSAPSVRLKRDLWARLLERVYGTSVASDELFLQHTYLTIVAKTMAVHVLGMDTPEPADLLAGRPFQEAGIHGVIESDFFDWPLAAEGGADLIKRVALQAGRFRLRDVQTDVLKGLYESLVDPEQRHYLGEYYTPDWLAARMCEHAIARPLTQRVVDPACGSGSFLFHSIRRFLAFAEAEGLPNAEALITCCRQVLGIDVHPVAVQIARVTYLLALGEERLRDHPPLAIPVYLGDSLQWDTEQFLAERYVQIAVPGSDRPLHFPFEVASDPPLFDAVIAQMLELSEAGATSEALNGWLSRQRDLPEHVLHSLCSTYDELKTLQADGRDHIWGFVARNQVRPVWLSQPQERADIVIGNPPWLPYRFMSPDNQKTFQRACEDRGIWTGQVAQQQDLSAYFFVRCVELYLKPNGLIAFVMPYAAMSRRQYAKFRSGIFAEKSRTAKGTKAVERVAAAVRFTEGWAFSDRVAPLFPVPSCVIFATNLAEVSEETGPRLPRTIWAAYGELPRRDATPGEADNALGWREEPWPAQRIAAAQGSPYSTRFRDGAVVFPSVLFRVRYPPAGVLGESRSTPLIESRRTNLEKPPWKELAPLRGNMEAEFIRHLYLGESIAPYRPLAPILAVVPWIEGQGLVDSGAARRAGFPHLGRWLAEAERLWEEKGTGRRTLVEQLDYYGQMSAQVPSARLRVVCAASGTLPAAAVLRDPSAVCEHAVYWASVGTEDEASYLSAILNSETARARVANLQARGQWGARHFDKVMLELPIPSFDPSNDLHSLISIAGQRAESLASEVPLKEGTHFIRARKIIRAALADLGLSAEIDRLVAELLGPADDVRPAGAL